jgi:hypothetical protein
MNKKIIVLVVALVVLVGLGARSFMKRGPSVSVSKPHQALGTVAAQETAKLVGGSGQLVIIVPETGGIPNLDLDTALEAFKTELKKTPGLTIATTETVNMTPPQTPKKSKNLKFYEPTALLPSAPPPAGQLGQLLSGSPEVKAIVCFSDLPPLNDADRAALQQQGAKVIVVSNWRPEYKALLKSKVVQLAIVPWGEPINDAGKKPRTLKDWFDRSYVAVTPETLDSLPEPDGAR